MLRGVTAGALDAVRGALYLLRHPRLLKWTVAPLVVVTAVAVVTLGWLVALLGAVGLVGWTSLSIGCATVIVTVAALVSGPFNELLAEAVETYETGKPPPRFSLSRLMYEIAISIAHAARRGVAHLAFIVVLLVIGRFVPVIGATVAAIGSGWVAARFAAYASYDATWARRHWSYRQKLSYLGARHWRTLGLGAVVAATLVVPGVNVIGLAIGSAGATLRMIAEEQARSPVYQRP
jgi:uncharacterized protein involved in cysteine biosynthesis